MHVLLGLLLNEVRKGIVQQIAGEEGGGIVTRCGQWDKHRITLAQPCSLNRSSPQPKVRSVLETAVERELLRQACVYSRMPLQSRGARSASDSRSAHAFCAHEPERSPCCRARLTVSGGKKYARHNWTQREMTCLLITRPLQAVDGHDKMSMDIPGRGRDITKNLHKYVIFSDREAYAGCKLCFILVSEQWWTGLALYMFETPQG